MGHHTVHLSWLKGRRYAPPRLVRLDCPCFTRVGECPFTGQHDLPSSLGVEVRRTPTAKVGCCRVGRLVQPHLEMETQRKCDGPRGAQELAPRKRLVLRSSRSRILATVAPELPGDHRTFSTFPSQGEIGRACQHDNNRPTTDFGGGGPSYFDE